MFPNGLNYETLSKFIDKYEEAKLKGHEIFTFEGDMIFVENAEYILSNLSLWHTMLCIENIEREKYLTPN